MAIYHLSVKTISRSAGRSATAAAAYRSGSKIVDERTGEIHDYTRKGGVVSADLVLPDNAPTWAHDRAAVWNAAEQAERRKNSTVAREFEIALPEELSATDRKRLAIELATELVRAYGCVADVAIHEPSKGGDTRNHHAHILLTTRRLTPTGFTEKTRELDDKKTGREHVLHWRRRFEEMQNEALQAAKVEDRVDSRPLVEQGIDRVPAKHLGPAATWGMRRGRWVSDIAADTVLESYTTQKEVEQIGYKVEVVKDIKLWTLYQELARAQETRKYLDRARKRLEERIRLQQERNAQQKAFLERILHTSMHANIAATPTPSADPDEAAPTPSAKPKPRRRGPR